MKHLTLKKGLGHGERMVVTVFNVHRGAYSDEWGAGSEAYAKWLMSSAKGLVGLRLV